VDNNHPPVPQLAIDDLTNVRVMSRDEPMGNVVAPGVPRVGDGGKNATPAKPPHGDVPPPGPTEQNEARCGTCQELISTLDKYCRNCGVELIRTCKKCGAENQTGKYCSNCGKEINGKKRKRPTAD